MANDTPRTPRRPAAKATARKPAPARKAPATVLAPNVDGELATPAPRRRTAVARPVDPEAVGKAHTEPAAAVEKPDTITFAGRTMLVRMVQPEQLVVWRRIAARLQGPEAVAAMDTTPRDGETAEEARGRVATYGLDQFDRILTIIGSVLPDPADVGWLEDQLLAGTIRLVAGEGKPGAGDIIALAMEHFTGKAQRQANAAPTTGPQPKARRRA